MKLLAPTVYLCLTAQFVTTEYSPATGYQTGSRIATNQEYDKPRITEKAFTADGHQYLAQVGDGMRVWSLTKNEKSLIFSFVPDYDYTQQVGDLVVTPCEGKGTCVSWRWCMHHDCSNKSGALMFSPLSKQIFRLEYEVERGLALSNNLADPKNNDARDWLLSWWGQWPGLAIPEKDIHYRSFDKR
jgi:hypothetical protein